MKNKIIPLSEKREKLLTKIKNNKVIQSFDAIFCLIEEQDKNSTNRLKRKLKKHFFGEQYKKLIDKIFQEEIGEFK